MDRFLFSRSYHFVSTKGRRKRFIFYMLERTQDKAQFLYIRKGEEEVVEAPITIEEGMEVAKFECKGREIFLKSDYYCPRGYRFSEEGRKERAQDKIRDREFL